MFPPPPILSSLSRPTSPETREKKKKPASEGVTGVCLIRLKGARAAPPPPRSIAISPPRPRNGNIHSQCRPLGLRRHADLRRRLRETHETPPTEDWPFITLLQYIPFRQQIQKAHSCHNHCPLAHSSSLRQAFELMTSVEAAQQYSPIRTVAAAAAAGAGPEGGWGGGGPPPPLQARKKSSVLERRSTFEPKEAPAPATQVRPRGASPPEKWVQPRLATWCPVLHGDRLID